jgi:hypothetical protein
MALQTNITLSSGINVPASYTRIANISLTHAELIVSTQTWSSLAARTDTLPTIGSASYSLPWQDSISLTGAYTLLKTQADFVSALDV